MGRYPAAQFEPATSQSAQRNSEALRSPNQTQPGPPKKQGRKSCSQLSKSSCTICDFYGHLRINEASRSPKQTQSGPAPANVGLFCPRNNVANRAVSFVPKGLRVRAVSRRIQTPHGRRWYSHVLLVSSRLTSSGAIREFKSP